MVQQNNVFFPAKLCTVQRNRAHHAEKRLKFIGLSMFESWWKKMRKIFWPKLDCGDDLFIMFWHVEIRYFLFHSLSFAFWFDSIRALQPREKIMINMIRNSLYSYSHNTTQKELTFSAHRLIQINVKLRRLNASVRSSDWIVKIPKLTTDHFLRKHNYFAAR